jgi:branched-chain amino acid aminotransferase
MEFLNINGKILRREEAGIRPDDHSYRYGDGLFETMKVVDENIFLQDLHFERLFHGFEMLKFNVPEFFLAEKLHAEAKELCRRNQCEKLAKIRLSVSRGNGGLYDGDEELNYVIECSSLKNEEKNLVIDVFPGARKSCDIFSNLKSANFLPYVMAAMFAKENKLDDCLVLNAHGRICDSTIANIFWIKDEEIFTPPLSEGCVAGVMRKWLMGKLEAANYKLQESICVLSDLENADEIFLTNVTRGIRSVKQFGQKTYTCHRDQEIKSLLNNSIL